MSFFIVFLLILLAVVSVGGPIIYLQTRKVFREQKNFERGLKMVPLLIHLPPISEDTETGGRDVRDLIDENVSKAQVMYNIIAGTLEKSRKRQFYGQRHFSFEIIGTKGFVQFYAAVPVSMLDVVKQAVVSAYPTSRLEEVTEHNIFSPVGKMSGTTGGELTLKENYAYPIATYQDLKRDVMQSLLNSLSTLEKEDGVGIQIMMRPANTIWRKRAAGIASKKRKKKEGKKGGEAVFSWVRQLFVAIVKPPEDKGNGDDKPELSSSEQSILDSIDEKTRSPGFEVLIRVVASSNISQRSQALLNSVISTFALFDSPGKNGFKFSPAKDIDSFVTAYIMRFFPQENDKSILNSVELATLFHFPDQRSIPTSQLERQGSKQVDGPRNIDESGILLGYNLFRGAKRAIRLSLEDRRRHMYIVGQTGVGKSIFMENLALQDMLAGRGFAFVDPHGETVDRLMSMVPKERAEDVIYFNPSDTDYPLGLNLFEASTPEQQDFLIQEVIGMLYKLYDPQRQGIIGPRYEHMFRNAALALMADPAGATFIDIPKLFNDPEYVKQKLKHVTDQTVIDFWTKEIPASQRSNDFGEVKGWFVSKFGAFLSNQMMRNIIGQTKSAFDIREIMDEGKLLFVNLSKGRTGELNSKLLGMIFVMKFQAAAMSRADIPEDQRKDFTLYVDEFQNFSTDSFATILSEARKYHLNITVANQFTTQLTEEIRDAVFGNVGSIVSFRVGAEADADILSKKFQPVFGRDDILRLPNYNTITQILIGGVPTQPFSMAAIPALGNPNPELETALKQLSAAKYGRPKAEVEKEIFARLETKKQPRPAFGKPGVRPAGGRPLAKPGSSSFLDDWLSKRGATPKQSLKQPQKLAQPSISQNTTPAITAITQQQPAAADATFGAPAPEPPVTDVTALKSQSSPSSNISSMQIDNNDVDGIANQLRSDLKNAPEPKKDGEIKIKRNKEAVEPDSTHTGDTIIIDKSGNYSPSDK